MAWFQWGTTDQASQRVNTQVPIESVDTLRQRARNRLIGSVVLVLIAVIGFPMLFDSQPRPVRVDVVVEIPDKNTVKPLVLPAPIVSAPSKTPNIPANMAEIGMNNAQTATKTIATLTPNVTAQEVEKTAKAKAEADKLKAQQDAEKTKAQQEAEKQRMQQEAARAKALLDGQSVVAAAGAQPDAAAPRFVVQFGSFADAAKARDVRQKVERAGLKTYSQIADTANGKLTRVRVGPFATRAEADKAARSIEALGLPAAILTL